MKYILIILTIFSCNKKEDKFLQNFNVSKKDLYKKEIMPGDLYILYQTNMVNRNPYKNNSHFYYGMKEEISKNVYLISYLETYVPLIPYKNKLYRWEDIYLCIYNKNKKSITSKLRISSDDPIFSNTKYENNKYIVKSEYRNIYPVENVNLIYEVKIEINDFLETYKIVNDKFIRIE